MWYCNVPEIITIQNHGPAWISSARCSLATSRWVLTQSDWLVIYTATAMRYIRALHVNFQHWLTEFAGGPRSVRQVSTIDSVYHMIIGEVFDDNLEDREKKLRWEVLIAVVFPQTPLSMDGIASWLGRSKYRDLHLVVHVPSITNDHVRFTYSFRGFIIGPDRSQGNAMESTKSWPSSGTNSCRSPFDIIFCRVYHRPGQSLIELKFQCYFDALQYSCLYCTYYLVVRFSCRPCTSAQPALHTCQWKFTALVWMS